VDPRGLTRVLVIGAGVLILMGAATIVLRYGYGHDYARGLVPKFDLDRELNVPTWFSSGLLLCAAALLGIIASAKHAARDRFAPHWIGLAVIFTLLSMDETASIHGLPGSQLRAAFDLPGFLHFAWVIPGTVAVAVFAAAYLRFLLHLPPGTSRPIAAAGVLVAGGALGGEMAQGAYQTAYREDAIFGVIALVEESLEMAGAIVFVHALTSYLQQQYGSVQIAFAGPASRSQSGRSDGQNAKPAEVRAAFPTTTSGRQGRHQAAGYPLER